jgi:hypothetical protein
MGEPRQLVARGEELAAPHQTRPYLRDPPWILADLASMQATLIRAGSSC